MSDRPNQPLNPERPRLDPEGRPIEPTTVVTPPAGRTGMGSGWFIAGIVVVLLIIGAIFYSNTPTDEAGAPQQATTDTTTAPTDTTTTGSTTGGADTAAPAPAEPAPKPAAPANNATGTDTAPAPAK